MNKKSFIILIASLTGLVTVGVSAVAISGANTIGNFKARAISDYHLTFDKDGVENVVSEDDYHLFDLHATPKHGVEVYADDVDAMGVLASNIGSDSIISFQDGKNVYPYFQANFTLKGPLGLPTCYLDGDLENAYVSISGLDEERVDKTYSVTVYINAQEYYQPYSGFTLRSIIFTYSCD